MSTIITSNVGFSDWVKVFHDRALTAAIRDRITHHAMILNMKEALGEGRETWIAAQGGWLI